MYTAAESLGDPNNNATMARREGIQRRQGAVYLDGPLDLADWIQPASGGEYVRTTAGQTLENKTLSISSSEVAVAASMRGPALTVGAGSTTRLPFTIVDIASGITANASGVGTTSYLQVVSPGYYYVTISVTHGAGGTSALRQAYATLQRPGDGYAATTYYSMEQYSSIATGTCSSMFGLVLAANERIGMAVLNSGSSIIWGSDIDVTLQARLSLVKVSTIP